MENNLSITYSRTTLGADSYWAYMVEKETEVTSDAVTSAQAAEIIDAVYGIKACGTEEEQEEASTGGTTNVPDFPTFESYQERMQEIFVPIYDPCNNVYEDNSYNATLNIYLSDMTKPYKLNLSNADVVQTAEITKLVNQTFPINSDRLQVDFPIQGSITCDHTVLDYNSKNILFSEHLIGSVTVKYETKYYEVIINVKEVDGDRGNCLCLLFYQETVNEVNISPPDIDEESMDVLDCTPASDPDSEDDPYEPIEHEEEDCYVRYIHNTRCRCAPYNLLGSYNEIRQVPCSTAFSSATTQGAYELHRSTSLEGYVTCPKEEGDWEGYDPEFYLDTCCVSHYANEVSLPICKEYKEVDYGGEAIIGGYDYYLNNALTNQIVKLIPVDPKDGICGEITYKQNVDAENCCDDPAYVAIDLDEDSSVELLEDGSSGYVFWENGNGNYEVSVRGQGFYLDPFFTKKSATTDKTGIVVYTENSCGYGTVTIDDGCTSVSHQIQSSEGQWTGTCYAYSYETFGYTEKLFAYKLQLTFDVDCWFTPAIGDLWGESTWVSGRVVKLWQWSEVHQTWSQISYTGTQWIDKSDIDGFVDSIAAQGYPPDLDPAVYAPNGPIDIDGGCSGTPACIWEC